MKEEFLYRFRFTEKLFERQELEKQEFYYATPDKLNDPAEGLKKTIWDGDRIVWQKLIEHYIHCFADVIQLSWIYFYFPISKYKIIMVTREQADQLNSQNFPKDTIIWNQVQNEIYFINTHTGILSTFKLLNDTNLQNVNGLQDYLLSIKDKLRLAGLCIHLDKSDINFIPNEHPNGKAIFDELYAKFLSLSVVKKFLEIRRDSNHNSDKEELKFHLSLLNRYAINTTVEVFKKYNLCPAGTNAAEVSEEIEKNTLFLLSQDVKNNSDSDLLIHNRASNMVMDAAKLRMSLVENHSNCTQSMRFLLLEFSEYYVQMLEDNIFPKWGAVCFSKNHSSLAMWGYYADAHKGVALKFQVEEKDDNYSINLYQPIGASKEVIYSY